MIFRLSFDYTKLELKILGFFLIFYSLFNCIFLKKQTDNLKKEQENLKKRHQELLGEKMHIENAWKTHEKTCPHASNNENTIQLSNNSQEIANKTDNNNNNNNLNQIYKPQSFIQLPQNHSQPQQHQQQQQVIRFKKEDIIKEAKNQKVLIQVNQNNQTILPILPTPTSLAETPTSNFTKLFLNQSQSNINLLNTAASTLLTPNSGISIESLMSHFDSLTAQNNSIQHNQTQQQQETNNQSSQSLISSSPQRPKCLQIASTTTTPLSAASGQQQTTTANSMIAQSPFAAAFLNEFFSTLNKTNTNQSTDQNNNSNNNNNNIMYPFLLNTPSSNFNPMLNTSNFGHPPMLMTPTLQLNTPNGIIPMSIEAFSALANGSYPIN